MYLPTLQQSTSRSDLFIYLESILEFCEHELLKTDMVQEIVTQYLLPLLLIPTCQR
jgi:hypothetical protein